MFSRRTKNGVFVLEGLSAVATNLYFNYLFFHMRDQFGFTNLGNLGLCALNGYVYCVAVWRGGQFAQRRGYFLALKLGFWTMGLSMLFAGLASTVAVHVAAMVLWTLGMSLTWPVLEAMTSEGETPRRLQRLLGVYNLVWAGSGGVAYFVGGAMVEKLGRGSIFWVPAGLHAAQLILLAVLERRSALVGPPVATIPEPGSSGLDAASERRRSALSPRRFLVMAWLANPFAYVAINALIPVIPRLAESFALGPMLAGFVCSIWFFARALTFGILWGWTGWHYRFRWLLGAYLTMAVSFVAILATPDLWLLVVAQITFGGGVGLIYYSSLFYSMDLGDTKSEHGGFHEAALGAGIGTGPAIGALALRFFPHVPNLHVWAVTTVLALGLAGLLALRRIARART